MPACDALAFAREGTAEARHGQKYTGLRVLDNSESEK
jgi:hypothetical protein